MAEDKKTAAAAPEAPKNVPANTPAVDATTTEDQKNSGPVDDVAIESPKDTATYYLKPGVKHTALIKGERVTLNKAGQKADLTKTQFAALSDKFYTADQYKAAKSASEVPAEGASAPDPATMEQATIEDHNAKKADAEGNSAAPAKK